MYHCGRYLRLHTVAAVNRRFFVDHAVRTPKSPVPSKFFATTPIYYLNAAAHIGHLYTTVMTDAICRWYEMLGARVIFSTGSDEHGLKVQQAANANGKDPQTFCDEMSMKFQKLFTLSDIKMTQFIRTTSADHHTAVRALWEMLSKRGFIYRSSYNGWYCVSDEAFLSEDQVTDGTDSQGNAVKVSKESGHPVEWMSEENYVFRLSQMAEPVKRWLDQKVIVPQNFEPIVRQFLSDGLPDLSVSRPASRIPWGIPVPGDDTQTIYVWFDAVANYLTVGGFPNRDYHWPVDVHVIGKDILKFHAIYWPAFLIAAGLDPPRKILCHSHWLMNKLKMSKSRGNVVDPFDRLQKFTSDGFRYYLMRDGVTSSDCNYSDERAVECINSDVVNTLCNLVSRCSSQSINKRQIFPHFDANIFDELATENEKNIMKDLYALPDVVDNYYRTFVIHHAIEATMSCLYHANSFVQNHQPWKLVKSLHEKDVDYLHCVLHVGLESARVASLALSPVIPRLSQRILNVLGCRPTERSWYHMTQSIDEERSVNLNDGHGQLFTRII